MKYKIFIILTFIFFITPDNNAQNVELLIKSVCDSLLIAQTGSIKDECVRDSETGMILSCFSFEGKPEWTTDFNGDGEKDLLIYMMDEGLGGGGNAFGYNYIAVIMKNGKIHETHPIFGGGKFSYGSLEINKVENGKIYTTYEENPASRSSVEDHYLPRQKIFPVFEYHEGAIIEQSYYNCPVADMDKRIFKDNLLYRVQRDSRLNDRYEEEQREKLYFDHTGEDYISASLHGCKNIYIRFSYDIPYSESIERNPDERKEALINYIKFLQHNTRYTSTIGLLSKKVENTDDFDKTDNSIVNMTYILPNSWEAQILIDKFSTSDGEEIGFTLNLNKYTEKTKTSFWDEIKR